MLNHVQQRVCLGTINRKQEKPQI